jgi:hypothetical protein
MVLGIPISRHHQIMGIYAVEKMMVLPAPNVQHWATFKRAPAKLGAPESSNPHFDVAKSCIVADPQISCLIHSQFNRTYSL